REKSAGFHWKTRSRSKPNWRNWKPAGWRKKRLGLRLNHLINLAEGLPLRIFISHHFDRIQASAGRNAVQRLLETLQIAGIDNPLIDSGVGNHHQNQGILFRFRLPLQVFTEG